MKYYFVYLTSILAAAKCTSSCPIAAHGLGSRAPKYVRAHLAPYCNQLNIELTFFITISKAPGWLGRVLLHVPLPHMGQRLARQNTGEHIGRFTVIERKYDFVILVFNTQKHIVY